MEKASTLKSPVLFLEVAFPWPWHITIMACILIHGMPIFTPILAACLKDIGQLQAAIKMYEQAVQCDGNFDIALANLANAVKDAGRVNDAISYYKRAVKVNPEFAEAVCDCECFELRV